MNRTDARGFVKEFNRAYDEKTELGNVCSRRYYERGDESLSFFQIGRHTTAPVDTVEEGRYRYYSEAVVETLSDAEKEFVAESLGKADDVPAVGNGKGVSGILGSAREAVGEPTGLLVPDNGDGDEAVSLWDREDRLRSFGDGTYVVGDDDKTDLWLYRHSGDGFFVVDGNRVTVVQKKGVDVISPSFDYVEEYGDLNDDMPLSVYFGEERKDGGDGGSFDLLFRVVVSEPVVEDGGACRLRY
jgi:hypothetical protein